MEDFCYSGVTCAVQVLVICESCSSAHAPDLEFMLVNHSQFLSRCDNRNVMYLLTFASCQKQTTHSTLLDPV